MSLGGSNPFTFKIGLSGSGGEVKPDKGVESSIGEERDENGLLETAGILHKPLGGKAKDKKRVADDCARLLVQKEVHDGLGVLVRDALHDQMEVLHKKMTVSPGGLIFYLSRWMP